MRGCSTSCGKPRHDGIDPYAKEMAGVHLDLDPALESAGIEHPLDAANGIA
jgi:hypothetical protein